MDTIKTGRHVDQLKKRREQIAVTLRHLGREQEEVERNTDWLDQAAYESRVHLLGCLTKWYVAEIGHIDQALTRAEQRDYGLCAACHRPIEERRLDAAPEAEFCGACQSMREGLQSAQA